MLNVVSMNVDGLHTKEMLRAWQTEGLMGGPEKTSSHPEGRPCLCHFYLIYKDSAASERDEAKGSEASETRLAISGHILDTCSSLALPGESDWGLGLSITISVNMTVFAWYAMSQL